jgi:hypothetical protein
MKPTISENKKSVLLYWITTIEEEISTFSSKLEDDQSVSDDDWKKYETAICKLYELVNSLKEEVEYS